jgi:hypothetical protein
MLDQNFSGEKSYKQCLLCCIGSTSHLLMDTSALSQKFQQVLIQQISKIGKCDSLSCNYNTTPDELYLFFMNIRRTGEANSNASTPSKFHSKQPSFPRNRFLSTTSSGSDYSFSELFSPLIDDIKDVSFDRFCIAVIQNVNLMNPRTQSALLEIISYQQIQILGRKYRLRKRDFIIVATISEPIKCVSINRMLLDSFSLFVSCTAEDVIHQGYTYSEQALELMKLKIPDIIVHTRIVKYIRDLAIAYRDEGEVITAKAIECLELACKSLAAFHGKTFVTPSQVQTMLNYCFEHRCVNTHDVLQYVPAPQ